MRNMSGHASLAKLTNRVVSTGINGLRSYNFEEVHGARIYLGAEITYSKPN